MIYDEVTSIMGDLEIGAEWIENMILNGRNEKINRYLKSALTEIRHALSDLSDADFEITTTPMDERGEPIYY